MALLRHALGGTHFCAQSRDRNSFPLIFPWGQNLALNRALGLAASHTLSAKFPWLCPVHPHMSAGRDFFNSPSPEQSSSPGWDTFLVFFCFFLAGDDAQSALAQGQQLVLAGVDGDGRDEA